MYALLGYFNFQCFGTALESTYFLVKLKLGIVKKELSTRKHLQFYLLKSPYSKLFENMGDEKSGQPHYGWL